MRSPSERAAMRMSLAASLAEYSQANPRHPATVVPNLALSPVMEIPDQDHVVTIPCTHTHQTAPDEFRRRSLISGNSPQTPPPISSDIHKSSPKPPDLSRAPVSNPLHPMPMEYHDPDCSAPRGLSPSLPGPEEYAALFEEDALSRFYETIGEWISEDAHTRSDLTTGSPLGTSYQGTFGHAFSPNTHFAQPDLS